MYNINTGMLSKAKGQILRVAGAFNMLFCDHDEEESLKKSTDLLPLVITENALLAAQDFVDVACQHGAYLAGRGQIASELKRFTAGLVHVPIPFHLDIIDVAIPVSSQEHTNGTFCLLLPGSELDLSALLAGKKFRS